jgi:hypothetical protein
VHAFVFEPTQLHPHPRQITQLVGSLNKVMHMSASDVFNGEGTATPSKIQQLVELAMARGVKDLADLRAFITDPKKQRILERVIAARTKALTTEVIMQHEVVS